MESDITSGGKYLCGCFHCSQTQSASGALHGAVFFPRQRAASSLKPESVSAWQDFPPHKWGQLLSMSALLVVQAQGIEVQRKGRVPSYISLSLSFMFPFHVIRHIFPGRLAMAMSISSQRDSILYPQGNGRTLWTHLDHHLRMHLCSGGIR